MFLKFITTEGVGLVKCFVTGLKAGTSSASSSFLTLPLYLGGSGMNEGNLPRVLFFFPGPAGLN